MTFAWDTLIAPAAALGGVALTLLASATRERTQFRRQVQLSRLAERREAYASFLATSDLIVLIVDHVALERRRRGPFACLGVPDVPTTADRPHRVTASGPPATTPAGS
ncbi:hypothetical protein Psi02_55600 [Planotetraspora silvatica]|uniref:Uncharacterized protein n=1 Tax=Planotetraspora silvatica TaxID=234614 RepID=A0A8J3UR49_9ACTN|nr:hypothetical protein Psi02_55600 [Planotetraspora silvatica]